ALLGDQGPNRGAAKASGDPRSEEEWHSPLRPGLSQGVGAGGGAAPPCLPGLALSGRQGCPARPGQDQGRQGPAGKTAAGIGVARFVLTQARIIATITVPPLPWREGAIVLSEAKDDWGRGMLQLPLPRVASLRAPSRKGRGKRFT